MFGENGKIHHFQDNCARFGCFYFLMGSLNGWETTEIDVCVLVLAARTCTHAHIYTGRSDAMYYDSFLGNQNGGTGRVWIAEEIASLV